MIRYFDNNKRADGAGKLMVEMACLSTDTKPTDGFATGSMAIEVDTGDVYLFDEASTTWNKMCSIKE